MTPHDNSPRKFALYQNYPNPFNPITTIRYDVPKLALIDKGALKSLHLYIYNIKVQLVKNIEITKKDLMTPGRHKLKWYSKDNLGRPVATGIYFYTLRAVARNKKFIKTKKMMIVK